MKKILLICLFSLYASAGFLNLNPSQLQEQIDKGTIVIDIRTPPEWKQLGVVPTSKTIMFFNEKGGYNVPAWLEELSKHVKDKEQPFVLVCRSGNRTGTVGNFLSKKMGFKNVYHLEHGIKSWIKEKRVVNK